MRCTARTAAGPRRRPGTRSGRSANTAHTDHPTLARPAHYTGHTGTRPPVARPGHALRGLVLASRRPTRLTRRPRTRRGPGSCARRDELLDSDRQRHTLIALVRLHPHPALRLIEPAELVQGRGLEDMHARRLVGLNAAVLALHHQDAARAMRLLPRGSRLFTRLHRRTHPADRKSTRLNSSH